MPSRYRPAPPAARRQARIIELRAAKKNVGDDTPVGDGDAAIQAYREAIRLNPRYAQAHNSIGSIHWRRFGSEGALRSFEAALAMDPNLASARQNLEMAKRGRGRFGVGLPE